MDRLAQPDFFQCKNLSYSEYWVACNRSIGILSFAPFMTGPTHIHSVGKVKKICSQVGQHHYYTALAKVRVHFYELVRPGSHPAVLQSRATRHDSQHSRPVALWRHSPGQFMHSEIASDNVRSQLNGGNSRMIGKNGCKEAV